jgi:hypothetical protein
MKEDCMPDMSWRSITPRQEEEAAIKYVDSSLRELNGTSSRSHDANQHLANALFELRAAKRAMNEQ